MPPTVALKDMSPKEIIAGVRAGEIKSCQYNSNAEYLKAMNRK